MRRRKNNGLPMVNADDTFNSVSAFLDYVRNVPSDNWSRAESRDTFAGGSWSDAVEQCEKGNSDLVKDLRFALDEFNAVADLQTVETVRDVCGEYFDITDAIAGVPECFFRDEKTDEPKSISLIVNVTAYCNVKNKTINNRGAAVVAMIDHFKRAGYAVELYAVEVTDFHHNYNVAGGSRIITRVKISTDPVDLSGLAFVFASPLFLRRLMFAREELVTGFSDLSGEGYGRPGNIGIESLPENSIYFPALTAAGHEDYDYRTIAGAVDIVQRTIKNYHGGRVVVR